MKGRPGRGILPHSFHDFYAKGGYEKEKRDEKIATHSVD